jgi:hypothetical protein
MTISDTNVVHPLHWPDGAFYRPADIDVGDPGAVDLTGTGDVIPWCPAVDRVAHTWGGARLITVRVGTEAVDAYWVEFLDSTAWDRFRETDIPSDNETRDRLGDLVAHLALACPDVLLFGEWLNNQAGNTALDTSTYPL